MTLVFCLQADESRLGKKSLNLLYSLINHKGPGSLYQCLKALNFLTSIQMELNTEVLTAFRFITIQLGLTEHGIVNYKKVLALALEFFRIVREEWLKDG